MLLKAKTVNKIKKLADSMGPNLSGSPFGNIRTEEFDYKLTKYLYALFSKENNQKITLTAPNNEKVTMDSDHYDGILRMMAEQDNSACGLEMYLHDSAKKSMNVRFNALLKEALHSFEQMVHQSSFVDKHMPKTKDGRINHFYRAFMRSLIANKERHLELIGIEEKPKNNRQKSNCFGTNLEEVRKEFKEDAEKHAKSFMSQREIEQIEKFKTIFNDSNSLYEKLMKDKSNPNPTKDPLKNNL